MLPYRIHIFRGQIPTSLFLAMTLATFLLASSSHHAPFQSICSQLHNLYKMESALKTPLIKLPQWIPSAFQEKYFLPALPPTPPALTKLLCFLTAPFIPACFMLHLKTCHLSGKWCILQDQLWGCPQVLGVFPKTPPAPNLFISWSHLVPISHSTLSSHFLVMLCSFLALDFCTSFSYCLTLSSIPLSKTIHFSKFNLKSVSSPVTPPYFERTELTASFFKLALNLCTHLSYRPSHTL